MQLPSQTDIRRHKVVWGVSPFLVCRTVTPLDVRPFRAHCNCDSCRPSRRRSRMEALSHPFGRYYDPPMSHFQLARTLRSRFDVCRNVFARENALCLLNMMVTEPNFVALCPVNSGLSLCNHVKEVICDIPSEFRSLNGLFFEKLKVYDLRHKGSKLMCRALRSHSIPPAFRLWSVPEVVDPWTSETEMCTEPPCDLPKFPNFSKYTSSIERLVFDRHFYGPRALNYQFRELVVMSDSSKKRQKSRRSLVSTYFILFSK